MPSTNKRVNLTLTDEIYSRVQLFKKENGFLNDASACLNLIVKQLDNNDRQKILYNMLGQMTKEDLLKANQEGIELLNQSNEFNNLLKGTAQG